MHDLIQQLIYGLSIGATYALIALGYTMVYGVLRLINFAHGEIYMAGAVIGLGLARAFTTGELPLWIDPGFVLGGSCLGAVLLSGIPSDLLRRFWVILPLLLLTPLGLWAFGRPVFHACISTPPSTATDLVFVATSTGLLAILVLAFRGLPWHRFVILGLVLLIVGTALKLLGLPLLHSLIRPIVRGLLHSPMWMKISAVFLGSMAICAFMGMVIEFLAYRPLRARPRLVVLITAIGVSLLLQNLAQQNAVFGPTPQRFPELIHARTVLSFPIGGRPVEISNLDLLSLILSFALMAVLTWVVLKTKVGLALRAVSFRVDTAALMGVNTDRTISWTFMLGSALAAVAGVLDAIRYDVKPLMGLMPGLKAFIAAVLGGIGSIPGALVGALLLGIVETMARFYLPRGYTEYADAVAFVVLILILLFKPSGLLGRATREKV